MQCIFSIIVELVISSIINFYFNFIKGEHYDFMAFNMGTINLTTATLLWSEKNVKLNRVTAMCLSNTYATL